MYSDSKCSNQIPVLPDSILIVVIRWLLSLSIVSLLVMPLSLNTSEASSAPLIQSAPMEGELVEPSSVHLSQLILGVQPEQTDDALHEFLAEHDLKLVKQWPDLHSILVEIEDPLFGDPSLDAAQQKSAQSTARQLFARLQETRRDLEELPNLRYVTYNNRIYAADLALGNPINRNKIDALPQLTESNRATNTRSMYAEERDAADSPPDDPKLPNQWALPMIRAVESWDISQGDPDVVIAVIDSGYDIFHPDLDEDSLWENSVEAAGIPGVDDDGNGYIDDRFGWDWVDRDNDTSNDSYGHGTHVGGTIAATTNNGTGISGLGQNIKIMPLRILDGQGAGYIAGLVDALDYASRERVRIANLSLVLQFDAPILAEAIATYAQTLLIISSTGNDGVGVYWPAEYNETVAVGATNVKDRYASLSNYGPKVNLAAPGVNILSTGRNGKYVRNSGTSMATAHVSALAGFVRSLRPDFSNDQILDVIKRNAVDVNIDKYPGRDDFLGYGRIDFYQTLQNASVGLQLLQDELPDGDIVPRYPIDSRVVVLTPATETTGALPVRGAVVQYELILEDGTNESAPTVTGYTLTNEDGVAFITFFAPSTVGRYLFRTTVGLEVINQPLTVYPAPYSVEILATTPSLSAGDGVTVVSTEVRDENGELILMPQPLRLETDYGSFENGQQSIDVLLDNGVYTTTFYAETATGVATIRANVADILSDSQEIYVSANQAASIKVLSDTSRINTASGETTATISVLVYDAYGNILDRPVPVELYTTMGEITPSLVQSANPTGMSAALTVFPDSVGEVTVWAALPSYQLLAKLTIGISDTASTTTLLPFVIRP